MDIMHAKRKAAIFTLSRQQKITPNCNGGREPCGAREAAAAGKQGGRLPGGFFSLCTCVRADHQELLNPGFVLFRQRGEHGYCC